jgi:hypothetical protein
MATLTAYYGLFEQAKRLNPDGSLATIVEVLNREMGMILNEAPWLPSNDTWINKTTRRGTLPVGSRRKLNAGVAKEVSRTTDIIDVLEMIETYAEYDKDYIDSFPEPARVRLQEAAAFLEGLGQTMCSDILYGDSNKDPDCMHGLAPRLDTIDGEFVIDGSGTGDDGTSIYVVTWGQTDVHLIYPKNEPNLGIKHTDKGQVTLTEFDSSGASTGKMYEGYRDHFQVKCGLVVRNPKCIGRVANIESAGDTNTFDNNDLVTLLNNMKTNASTRIYCNQTIKTQAEILMLDKSNMYWTPEKGLDGLPFVAFRGIPVRMIDKDILLNTETTIS